LVAVGLGIAVVVLLELVREVVVVVGAVETGCWQAGRLARKTSKTKHTINIFLIAQPELRWSL
jgi:hypothetical protein